MLLSWSKSISLPQFAIFLDLFLLRWQNSFWWDWRISSCSWIQYVEFRIAGFFCFGLFFSFWIILSRLLDEITHKEVETCLGFSASFHLCLPKSLLSLLPLDVHMHIGEHAHSHTYIYTHTQVNTGLQQPTCGYLGQHPSRSENRTRSAEIFHITAVWNSTCWTASVIKEFLMSFCRMDARVWYLCPPSALRDVLLFEEWVDLGIR